jgi:hypothetical protein
MTPYRDRDGDSGITAYEIGDDSIKIEFKDGSRYFYDATAPGARHVEEMCRLAESGDGLNTYINRYVRSNHAGKLR